MAEDVRRCYTAGSQRGGGEGRGKGTHHRHGLPRRQRCELLENIVRPCNTSQFPPRPPMPVTRLDSFPVKPAKPFRFKRFLKA